MKKGALELEKLVKLILAIVILIVLIGTIVLIRGKEIVLIDKIKDFFYYR